MSDNKVATEGGHWYDAKTGEPRYTVIGKNGKERPTKITDAKAHGWVPSVTTVVKVLAAPGLDNWKRRQVLLSALTLTRLPAEDDDVFIARIMADSKEQARKAAELGTAIHGDIERFLTGRQYERAETIDAVKTCLAAKQIDIHAGRAEHSFAHPDGFGGKVDWHNEGAVVDFKTKEKVDPTKTLAWPEHAMQLAAYAYGLGIVAPRCINVFIGTKDGNVAAVEHDPVEIERGLEMFKLCLAIWKIKNEYDPGRDNSADAALARAGL